jgi:ABC-type multidrug transport system fused ATPase/permease subunit
MFKKLNEILVKREKLKLVAVFLGAIFMSILGTLGIAPIMPFTALAADPAAVMSHEITQKFIHIFPFINEDNILLYSGIGVVAFIVLATGSNLGFRWMMMRINWGIANTMALRLLENYCYSPYEIFLTKDTKQMSFKILNEISTLCMGILMPVAHVWASLFTVLFMFSLLLIVNFQISMVIFVCLGVSYVLIYFLFKKPISGLGETRVGEAAKRFHAAEEILQNIKTTKVFGKEKFFLQKFSQASHKFTEAKSKTPLYMHSPKAMIETITFGGVVAIILFLDSRGGLKVYLPTLSLFALAGYRLLPALQQVYYSITDIKFHLPGLNSLHADIMELPFELVKENKEEQPPADISFHSGIYLRNIEFSYPSAEEPLFQNLDLSIQKGQRIAFIGATGSGKSTLVDLIMGLLAPQAGSISIDDHELNRLDWVAWRKRVGYVPQDIFLINENIRHNIAFGLRENEISEEALKEAAGIAEIRQFIEEELEEGFDSEVGERGIRLSGGQKQRIGLARALYHKPEVLVLDEATSALDNKTEKSIMSSIDRLPQELTIIMVAHRLSTVKSCDIIYVLEEGTIVDSGSYEELKHRCKLFEEMEEPQEVT